MVHSINHRQLANCEYVAETLTTSLSISVFMMLCFCFAEMNIPFTLVIGTVTFLFFFLPMRHKCPEAFTLVRVSNEGIFFGKLFIGFDKIEQAHRGIYYVTDYYNFKFVERLLCKKQHLELPYGECISLSYLCEGTTEKKEIRVRYTKKLGALFEELCNNYNCTAPSKPRVKAKRLYLSVFACLILFVGAFAVYSSGLTVWQGAICLFFLTVWVLSFYKMLYD